MILTIIPILKPKKPPEQVSSYRPIALTNCMEKLLEKIVSKRFNWYLESKTLICNQQFGFRNKRNTIDLLVNIESDIKNALILKHHTVLITFDLEKAYDRIRTRKIMWQLKQWIIEGNLLHIVQNFLTDRKFTVKAGQHSSDLYKQENGVPQGSVLSVILFIIAINNITENLPITIKTGLYADDLLIFASGKDMNTIKSTLQTALHSLESWAQKNGATFSSEKTHCIHFCRKRNCPNPSFNSHTSPIHSIYNLAGETPQHPSRNSIVKLRNSHPATRKPSKQTNDNPPNPIKCLHIATELQATNQHETPPATS